MDLLGVYAMALSQIHYRYSDYIYGHDIKIRLEVFYTVKETPKGYWVISSYIPDSKKRWVSKTSTKRYCYPTKEEAFNSYKIRKNRHLQHIRKQMDHVNVILSQIESIDQRGISPDESEFIYHEMVLLK